MKKVMVYLIIIIVIILVCIFGINAYVKISTKNQIIKENEYDKLSDIDCIIILGAGVWGDKPSHMLEDRLLEGIKLYENNVSSKIIMSGDHGKKDYDEVNIMKNYAIEKGVPSENIFMDHAGFSTYESMYRARDVFKAQKVLIVTQKYHLYRAVYIARQLGIEAYGLDREELKYPITNNIREAAARVKDFFYCIAEPEPTRLRRNSYAVFCLKKKNTRTSNKFTRPQNC